ncbi:MAG: 5-carboxymethyl-2-hydroxymuconate Delta-isomerase [bacterium]|nr:5-carboxymethyl-2-hydroxymuconate Delta-isomerase [bacterium]MCY3890020.1 5-carboxymethyl-2-hydroxymuconate Delta-isomerase [bacterium]MCY3961248.1 5-carboxymethyl-2-hydroxymuconate Delta-isomerase [bacterium]MCY4133949.1 5-carboxymethyl-2-hydroxymuconate Delta-isomerase [bacterium]MDE0115263.1 5-carboxymethyl-2-hydroxymuconate Delta-isomerase [bacterium]
MPHITVEHSENLAEHHDIDALVAAIHTAALDHGLPELAALRTRAVSRRHYRIASGDPLFGFVAIDCRIAPGRDAAAKHSFLEQVLDAAEAQLESEGSSLHIAWSMEITEVNPEFRINRNRVRDALGQS